jgi:hypothetical protein
MYSDDDGQESQKEQQQDAGFVSDTIDKIDKIDIDKDGISGSDAATDPISATDFNPISEERQSRQTCQLGLILLKSPKPG